MASAVVFAVFPLAMAFAAVSDLLSMTIPNRVPIVLALSFFALALLTGMPATTVGLHLAAAAGCLAVTFGCFAMGWMGGGDAKLIAATALWFGPTSAMLDYAGLASLYGGLLTVALLILRWQLRPVTGIGFVDRLLDTQTGVPYGIALGLAGLSVCLTGPWIDAALSGSL